MKKARFSEEHIVKILREAHKTPVSEVAHKHGVSDVTIYAWRKRFRQLEPVDLKRLRQLEGENVRRKKVLAERVMDIEILKEVAGYRRIEVFLDRRGHVMSVDRTYRLWNLRRLQVPRKKPLRRVAASCLGPLPATAVAKSGPMISSLMPAPMASN